MYLFMGFGGSFGVCLRVVEKFCLVVIYSLIIVVNNVFIMVFYV